MTSKSNTYIPPTPQFAIGEQVRLDERSRLAYHRSAWGRVGIVESTAYNLVTKIRRYMVWYAEGDRAYIREEHLERVNQPAAPHPLESESAHHA